MLSGGGSGLAAASSSSSVASRLYASSQQRNSRRNSFSSDAPAEAGELMSFNDISDFNHSFNEANNELSKMSQRMRELQDLQLAATEEKSRLKTENAVLQERVHLYEEQLQTAEQIWSEKLDEEKHRLKDILARVTREKELEAEKDALRYQVLEGQLKAVQREKERAEEQAHNCQCKANTLRDQLHELQAECERIESEKHQLKTEFERYQLDTLDRMENMETNAEILEQLHRQSDQIRSFPRQGSLTDQIMMLEDEVERLKIENRNLREQNKDMQAQILHDSVECGRTLLDNGSTAAPSLAAELGGMDSQGLMNALREQELVNQRLRNYVNGILMRIIERHPDILEIKEGEDGTQPPPRPSTILSNDSDVNKTTNHKSDSEGCPAGTVSENHFSSSSSSVSSSTRSSSVNTTAS